jgi:hypothetical protein
MTLLPGCNLAALVLVNVPASQSGFQGTIDTPAGAAAGTQQDAVIGGETPQGVSGSGVLLAGGGPVALAQLFGPSPAVTPRSPALPPGTTSGSTVSSIAQQPSLAGSSLLEGGALWLPAGERRRPSAAGRMSVTSATQADLRACNLLILNTHWLPCYGRATTFAAGHHPLPVACLQAPWPCPAHSRPA